MERNRLIAEGAGASSLAAVLAGTSSHFDSAQHEPFRDQRKVVCVISGGNIDAGKLQIILEGGMP
ncbi:MAG: hypothetical protein JKX73_08305 [Flavobacteriales bacterium]|nr:hypothetical protein [Flavobacteriales bacterium]